MVVTSCRKVLVYDIDALIKGFTADDVSAIKRGISTKKMRILDYQDPDMDEDNKWCTDTAMNKFSITRFTEYKHPHSQIKIKKLDFWSCDETPEDSDDIRHLRTRSFKIN